MAGYFSDKLGDRYLLLCSNFIVLLGWIICQIGVIKLNYWYFLIGNEVQSLAETILDELSCIVVARWFMDANFTFANGVYDSFSMLPSIFCGLFLVKFYYATSFS